MARGIEVGCVIDASILEIQVAKSVIVDLDASLQGGIEKSEPVEQASLSNVGNNLTKSMAIDIPGQYKTHGSLRIFALNGLAQYLK